MQLFCGGEKYITAEAILKCVPHVNLLQNSAGPFFPQADPNGDAGRGQTNPTGIDQWKAFQESKIVMTKGDTYTVSASTNGVFSGTHDPSKPSNKCLIWLMNGRGVFEPISSDSAAKENTFVWDHDTGTYFLRVNRYGADSQVKCWNIKIEHGSQATDWTPCPLDS